MSIVRALRGANTGRPGWGKGTSGWGFLARVWFGLKEGVPCFKVIRKFPPGVPRKTKKAVLENKNVVPAG